MGQFYFQVIKAMASSIDFPLTMNYRAEEQKSNVIANLPKTGEANLMFKAEKENYNDKNYFYFLNGHNDVVYFADANFTEENEESYEYNAWGKNNYFFEKNNILYTSREFDNDTNLQFNRLRYYNIELGRFTQKDLIFIKNSNAYIYTINNPINLIDPFGLYGRWINLFLPSPGGSAFAGSSCDNPGSNADCKYLCITIGSCEACCRTLYKNDWQSMDFELCLSYCATIQ
jgi:RHS repeat-associated protein